MFRENDYAAALADAQEQSLPLFVDAWAPWCHSCVSMKAFVLNDPALYSVVPKFVWASVDTEHSSSQAFSKKFPMEVWPTLWVIDAKTEQPILEWAGAATAVDLASLLEGTLRTVESTDPKAQAAWAAWQAGNRHVAAGQRESGIAKYQLALSDAPVDFVARPRVVEALVFHLSRAAQFEPCVETAVREFSELPKGTSRLNTVLSGLGCAGKLSASGSGKVSAAPVRPSSSAGVVPWHGARERLLGEALRIVGDDTEPVLADDRSSLFQEVVYQQESTGEKSGARASAEKWSAFLEREAKAAPTPAARAVFDYHRVLAHTAIGAPERSIPMLEQSERDFPDDYNPPSRLAKVQLDLGQLDLALVAVDRALSKVYGPRTLRVMKLKADILVALKEPQRANEVLSKAVAFGESAGPLGEGYQRLLVDLKKRLAESRGQR